MATLFSDTFTVTADTNISSYPSGSPDYAYVSGFGSGADLTVNATNDRLQSTYGAGADRIARIINAAVSSTNQEISADCYALSSAWEAAYPVLRAASGSGDFYTCPILLPEANEVRLYRSDGGSFSLLASANLGLTSSGAYTMTARASGVGATVVLEVVVNGTLAIVHLDTSASRKTSGNPGIGVYDGNGSGDIYADNIVVSSRIFAAPVGEVNSATDATTYSTASFTPQANALLLACYNVSATSNAAATITGFGDSWTEIGSGVEFNTGASPTAGIRAAYTQLGSSPSADTVDLTYGSNRNGMNCFVIEVTGHNTSTPIATSNVHTKSTDAASVISQDMNSLSDAADGIFILGARDGNARMTPRSTMTELADGGHATPGHNLGVAYEVGGNQNGVNYSPLTGTADLGALLFEVLADGVTEVVPERRTLTVVSSLAPLGSLARPLAFLSPLWWIIRRRMKLMGAALTKGPHP